MVAIFPGSEMPMSILVFLYNFYGRVNSCTGPRDKTSLIMRPVVKTALLVYKFQYSGYPKYFEPFPKPRHSVCKTYRSQSDVMLLEVPHFAF